MIFFWFIFIEFEIFNIHLWLCLYMELFIVLFKENMLWKILMELFFWDNSIFITVGRDRHWGGGVLDLDVSFGNTRRDSRF